MRILVYENFPLELVEVLRESGNDVLWARTDCSGWSDVRVLNRAEEESRIVFTLDKDFLPIGRQRRPPLQRAGVVLFRIHPTTAANLRPVVEAVVKSATD
ncbi:MAG: DUF5615 family PIN-like protein [Bryobacteraceae bacterium]